MNNIGRTGLTRILTVVCDLTVMYICYIFAHTLIPDAFAAINPNTHLLIVFSSYVAWVAFFPPKHIERETTGPQVVTGSLMTVMAHFFISAGVYSMAQIWMGDRPYLIVFWGLFATMLVLEHLLVRSFVRYLRGKGKFSRTVVLIGKARDLCRICSVMAQPENGYQIKGVFSNDAAEELPKGISHLGTTAEALSYLTENKQIQSVYCQPETLSHEQAEALFNHCIRHKTDFYDMPELMHSLQRRMETKNTGFSVLITAVKEPISHWPNKMAKRAVDVVLSLLCLSTIFPIVYMVAAFFIKRQSQGPVFTKKTFEGRNGRKVNAVYFRTKHSGADMEDGTFPFGALMRSLHIDEMPLLFNILKGEVSFAGPRYHTCRDMNLYHLKTDNYQVCELVKPGLSGCGTAESEDSSADDIYYVQNWSIWLDAKLILQMWIKTLIK